MAKYIDAERLKCGLEKRLKNVRDYMNGAGMKYKGPEYYKAQGKESVYDAILNIIDSIQQELVVMDCSFEGGTYRINGVEKPFNAGTENVAILEIKEKRNDTE